jgi:DNA-3-methyladenine glycosylase
LPQSFYARDPVSVARELIGMVLLRRDRQGLRVARIVEVEAYLAQDDPASHSFRGLSKRNASMFARAGMAYVYTIHARFCLNAVTEVRGVGSAVLIRAAEPLQGIERMQQLRNTTDERNLLSGPAKLCAGFGLDLSWDGWDLTRGKRLWIANGEAPQQDQVIASRRIGISKNAAAPLRFCLAGSRYLSRPARPVNDS